MVNPDFKTVSPSERIEHIRQHVTGQTGRPLPDEWLDWLLTEATGSMDAKGHIDASHLHPNLSGLKVRDRFSMSGKDYMITDIGNRTMCAVHIDDKAKSDPSWLNGPSYALAEIVIDEDDFGAISAASSEA